jgi:hypothetical protein
MYHEEEVHGLYALSSKRGSGLGLYKAVGCYSVGNSVLGSTYDPRDSLSARTTHYNSFRYCSTHCVLLRVYQLCSKRGSALGLYSAVSCYSVVNLYT